ncbi:hypothetical protein D3C85_989830 [compost metagenome]
MVKVAIRPVAFSTVSKASLGTESLGMATSLTCCGSTIWPKGISTTATTTFSMLESVVVFIRAVSQVLAIQAAPSPSSTDSAINDNVRELMVCLLAQRPRA